jgi:hypothetical protein
LFDALTLLVKENRGAGDFGRLSDLSGMIDTLLLKSYATVAARLRDCYGGTIQLYAGTKRCKWRMRPGLHGQSS